MKLTPLNIVSAVGLVAAVLLLFDKSGPQSPMQADVSGLLAGLCVLMAVVAFVSDLIFRKFITGLNRIWIIEGAFILFTVVLMFILRMSIN